MPEYDLARFRDNLFRHSRLAVLTGAGISAASGIPTYRDDRGDWQRSDPIQHRDFLEQAEARQRYWARSMAGWPAVMRARPNRAHQALAELESRGQVAALVTQNVDRLHQRAGHREVVDLHGRLDRVRCLDCGELSTREALQDTLKSLNPGLKPGSLAGGGVVAPISEAAEDPGDVTPLVTRARPDGDADVPDSLVSGFKTPGCQACGGTLMPDVVFFGGSVPRERVDASMAAIESSDALLVVGSSLMVYSGFRFARHANRLGKPLYIINRGKTRADDLANAKLEADCEEALEFMVTTS